MSYSSLFLLSTHEDPPEEFAHVGKDGYRFFFFKHCTAPHCYDMLHRGGCGLYSRKRSAKKKYVFFLHLVTGRPCCCLVRMMLNILFDGVLLLSACPSCFFFFPLLATRCFVPQVSPLVLGFVFLVACNAIVVVVVV